MSYVFAFLGFAALIILHEAGHFAAAKAVGMRVERFSLFFGPLLVKTRRGETEYGVGPIPLGGYVKITGMNPHEDIPPEHRARAYYNQPVWKRIVVISAGPAVNLLIAFAILYVLLLANGQTVLRHGQPVPTTRIASVGPHTAADGVLRPGDQIVAVDGVRGGEERLRAAISAHRCAGPQVTGCVAVTPAKLVVRRDGRLVAISVFPRYSAKEKRPLIGFAFASLTRYPGPAGSASAAVSGLWSVTEKTVSTVARVFEPQERKQLHGVVGGFATTQQSFATSTSEALLVLAFISLSLGVINLFPFLPLDGGHIFWALAEKIRGKRIPFVVMERAGMVGFVLIILLFFIGLSNDISTLSGQGFNVR